MKKIIYVSFYPLTKKIARGWFLDYLIEKGVSTEYWFISKTNEGTDNAYKNVVVNMSDYSQLEKRISSERENNNSYLLLMLPDFHSYKLFKILTRNKCKMCIIIWGKLPMKKNKYSISRVLNLLVHFNRHYRLFLGKMIVVFLQKIGLIKPFDIIFTAEKGPYNVKFLRQVPISLCDYDTYMSLKNTEKTLVEGQYAVFLDIYLPYHRDINLVGVGYLDHKKYYDAINRFFELIERKYNIKVVIAAHPSSQYDKTTFNGRTVLKDVTPQLVKHSKMVISHHSTSISYAVLEKKPLVFIYTDEMQRIYKSTVLNFIEGVADYLDSSIYNVDDVFSVDQISVKPVNNEKYDMFKYEFLTSKEVENKMSRDIFLQEIVS